MIFIKKSIVTKNKSGTDWGDCSVFTRFHTVLDKLDSDHWCFLSSEVHVHATIPLYASLTWNARFSHH